jgi:preprotein translocase subunit SecF
MGAVVLQEFAIALLIGLFSGAYSSLFIASPLLAWLKEREPRYRDIKRRVDARGGEAEVVAATVMAGATAVGSAPARPAAKTSAAPASRSATDDRVVTPGGRAIPPRPRKKTKRSR